MKSKKKKFYAVRKGLSTGIFYTWLETQKAIKGYSGAEYKSFDNIEDANTYINLYNEEIEDNTSIPTFYIDGSYNSKEEIIGWGGILVHNHKILDSFFDGETFEDNGLEGNSRNIKGEINAVKEAINIAHWHNLKEIAIGYDYNGLKYWAIGEWKTNLPLTKEYRSFMEQEMKDIKIHWIKIKSHTGHKYNEMADIYAKKGAKL